MALESQAQLWFFCALFAGIAVGFVVGSLTQFEFGLAAGLLIPGAVAAWFAVQLLLEYRAFTAPGAGIRSGRVVDVRDVPVGDDVTAPEPVIEYVDSAGVRQTLAGPRSGGYEQGERVSVIPARGPLTPARAGQPGQLRGGAIAMMLFATFPLSLGAWFMAAPLLDRAERPPARRSRGQSRSPAAATARRAPSSWRRQAYWLCFVAMFCGVLWVAWGRGELIVLFHQGFGAVAGGLVCYGALALTDPRVPRATACGMLVLAVNFGVWALALWLLSRPAPAW
ncbi:MAG: hypothetical protein AB7Q76_11585 [Gammaproteobacteria bacterium]